jgi:hypothetical protein
LHFYLFEILLDSTDLAGFVRPFLILNIEMMQVFPEHLVRHLMNKCSHLSDPACLDGTPFHMMVVQKMFLEM